MATEKTETERRTALDYATWRNDRIRADDFYKERSKKDRELKKKHIKELRTEIQQLKEAIKKPLPKRRPTTKAEYDKYVQEAREGALIAGAKWIEPVQEAVL